MDASAYGKTINAFYQSENESEPKMLYRKIHLETELNRTIQIMSIQFGIVPKPLKPTTRNLKKKKYFHRKMEPVFTWKKKN